MIERRQESIDIYRCIDHLNSSLGENGKMEFWCENVLEMENLKSRLKRRRRIEKEDQRRKRLRGVNIIG